MIEEAPNRFHLPWGIPAGVREDAVRRIVQCRATPMIRGCVGIGAGLDQELDQFDPVASCSEMQRGIAPINPVKNPRVVQVRVGNEFHSQTRRRLKQRGNTFRVVVYDGSEQLVHLTIRIHVT